MFSSKGSFDDTVEYGFAVGQASVVTTDALGDTCIVAAGFYASY